MTRPRCFSLLLLIAVPGLARAAAQATSASSIVQRPASALGSKGAPLEKVQISSETLKIRGADSRAVFGGKVRVRRGADTLRCRQLTVLYDSAGQVQSFVATGAVVMRRGTRTIRAERAELDNLKNLVTLSGEPELEEGSNLIRGELVRFNLLSDEVEVLKVRARLDPKSKAASKTQGRDLPKGSSAGARPAAPRGAVPPEQSQPAPQHRAEGPAPGMDRSPQESADGGGASR